jgi:hypothetical protein
MKFLIFIIWKNPTTDFTQCKAHTLGLYKFQDFLNSYLKAPYFQ